MAETYRNYKLASGEEIISKVISSNESYVTLHRPMLTKIITLDQPVMGGTNEFMILRPWGRMTNEIQFNINRNQIITDNAPKPEIVSIYLDELEKEDVTNDIYNEMVQDGELDITNDLETYVKNKIMTDLENTPEVKIPEQEEEPIPTDAQGNVMMNFVVPPALFLAFLMSGIVSFNEEDDEEGFEFDIDTFMQQAKDKMIRKQQKKKDDPNDFETHFRNWNPEP